jgi:hypothetical protein
MKLNRFLPLGILLSLSAVPVQAATFARITWSCSLTSPSGDHFLVAGTVDSMPLSGTDPLIGSGRVTVDKSGRFLGNYDVWGGQKQFELTLYGAERDGYKPSLILRIPRAEYADQGGGMAIITTLDDPAHGGVNYSDFVGVGYCSSEWSEFEAPESEQ